MVKFYASAIFAINTKKRFKIHFSVWNCRLSKMNEENVMYSLSWPQKNQKYQTLCKDYTEIANEKNLAKVHIQNFKRKKSFLYEQFFIEWKIIFIALSDLP